MMLIFVSPRCTEVFLARIVMPFSRSRSPESMTRSATSWFSRKEPDCQSIASTRVVFPWSTWATIATLRRSSRAAVSVLGMAEQPSRASRIAPVRAALLGAGDIAEQYVRGMAQFPLVELVAVADRDVERARERAAEWGVRALRPDELLADAEVELVVNLTPPLVHVETTRAALEAG